ncbi:hypothetical protein L0244_25865 [bacterium]|nr:hypothetical protein [bacterium]
MCLDIITHGTNERKLIRLLNGWNEPTPSAMVVYLKSKGNPLLKNLERDPRWPAFLKKMKPPI